MFYGTAIRGLPVAVESLALRRSLNALFVLPPVLSWFLYMGSVNHSFMVLSTRILRVPYLHRQPPQESLLGAISSADNPFIPGMNLSVACTMATRRAMEGEKRRLASMQVLLYVPLQDGQPPGSIARVWSKSPRSTRVVTVERAATIAKTVCYDDLLHHASMHGNTARSPILRP